MANFRLERADSRPKRLYFRAKRPDFRPERADFRPERAWGDEVTKERTDKQKSPVFHGTSSPLGLLPKNLKADFGEARGITWRLRKRI